MKRLLLALVLGFGTISAANAQSLLVGEYFTNRILSIAPDGTSTVFAQPSVPSGTRLTGFSFDSSGNLFAARLHGSDANPNNPNNGVIKVTPTGIVSDFVSITPSLPNATAVAANGDVYVSSVTGGLIRRYSSTGASLGSFSIAGDESNGLAFDSTGTLFVALNGVGQVRRYSATGADLGLFAAVPQASALAFDAAGNLLVGTRNGVINRFTGAGASLGTFATTPGADFNGLAITENGDVFATNYQINGGDVRRFSATGAALGTVGGNIASPVGIAVFPSASASAAAPEPSALALLALPVLGAITRRRKVVLS